MKYKITLFSQAECEERSQEIDSLDGTETPLSWGLVPELFDTERIAEIDRLYFRVRYLDLDWCIPLHFIKKAEAIKHCDDCAHNDTCTFKAACGGAVCNDYEREGKTK